MTTSTPAIRKTSRRSNLWLGGILLLALVARLFYLIYTGGAQDDAYITFRYARMLASGQGFVYNPGQAGYGTTTPLLTILLAGWMLLPGADPLTAARVLGIAAALGAIVCTILALRRLGFGTAPQVCAGLALTLSSHLWVHDTGGMETALLPLFLAATWLALITRRWGWAGFLAGLFLWTRIDAAPWVLLLCLAAWVEDHRGGLRLAWIAGLTYLPWIIFAWAFFGSPVPHTLIAKEVAYAATNHDPLLQQLWVVLQYMMPFTFFPEKRGIALVLILLTLGLAAWISWQAARRVRSNDPTAVAPDSAPLPRGGWTRLNPLLVLPVFAVLEIARLVLTRATFFNRYFVPALWAVLVLLGTSLGMQWEYFVSAPAKSGPDRRPAIYWPAVWLASGLTLIAGIFLESSLRAAQGEAIAGHYFIPAMWLGLILFLLLALAYFQRRGLPSTSQPSGRAPFPLARLGQIALPLALAAALGAGAQQLPTALDFVRAEQVYRYEGTLKAMGQWLAHNTPAGSSVLLEPLGYVGYFSGRVMVDEVGLVTPAVTALKRAGNDDTYTYLPLLRTDYVIQHCDDLVRWLNRDVTPAQSQSAPQDVTPPATNLLRTSYNFAALFNPLNFDPRVSYDPSSQMAETARQSCYEIWAKK